MGVVAPGEKKKWMEGGGSN